MLLPAVELVDNPAAKPNVKLNLRQRHVAEHVANLVESLDVQQRLLLTLSRLLSRKPAAVREANLVARLREMLLPWPTQQKLLSLLSKSTNPQLGSSTFIDLAPPERISFFVIRSYLQQHPSEFPSHSSTNCFVSHVPIPHDYFPLATVVMISQKGEEVVPCHFGTVLNYIRALRMFFETVDGDEQLFP